MIYSTFGGLLSASFIRKLTEKKIQTIQLILSNKKEFNIQSSIVNIQLFCPSILPRLPCETFVAVVSPGLNSCNDERSLPRRFGRSYWGGFNRGSDQEINKTLSALSVFAVQHFPDLL